MPKPAQFDGSRSDFTPYGFTCELWTPTHMSRPDRHNEIELNFLESGTLTYLLGGRRTTVPPRCMVAFWGAIPHQIVEWETAKPYYVVTLPLAWFLGGGFPDHLTHPMLSGEIVVDPAPNVGDLSGFSTWVDDFGSGEALRERAADVEIHGRLLRLAVAFAGRRMPVRPARLDPSLSRADQLACYIARHYQEPLTAASIAKAVGLHPNYAMNLFRKTFGSTMVDFLMRHRVSHAQRLLVTTSDSVIGIATASGFRSLSRFNEAFKRACDCSPRDYRKAHRRTG